MAFDTVDSGDFAAEIDSSDREALARARTVSHLLDDAIRVPGTGTRIGLDPVLGVLPVSGDAVAAVGALYVVAKGVEIGLPTEEIVKMLGLVAGDFLVGSIPVLGPFLDAGWKVNKRNVERMEAYLEAQPSDPSASEMSPSGD